MNATEQKKKGGPKKATANPAKEIKEPINHEEVKDLEQEVQSTIANTNLDEIVNL